MGHTLRILEPKLGFTLYFQAREEKVCVEKCIEYWAE